MTWKAVNAAAYLRGLALIGPGFLFMIGEAFLPSFGILDLGGIVAFVAGTLMLIDTELPGYGIPLTAVLTLAAGAALLFAGTVRLALKTRRQPVTSGASGMMGSLARVENLGRDNEREAWVRIEGEMWKAVSSLPLKPAQSVKVLGRDGLTLRVGPLDQPQGAR